MYDTRSCESSVIPSKTSALISERNRSLGLRGWNSRKSPLHHYGDRILSKMALENAQFELPPRTRSTFITAFSPDNSLLASCHGDHNIHILDVKTRTLVKSLSGHERSPWCVTFHPGSNEILASGSLNGEVRVWDLRGDGSESWTVNSNELVAVASLSFHPYDHVLAIAAGNEIHFWDWSLPHPFASVKTSSENEKVRFVRFDPWGHSIITGVANAEDDEEESEEPTFDHWSWLFPVSRSYQSRSGDSRPSFRFRHRRRNGASSRDLGHSERATTDSHSANSSDYNEHRRSTTRWPTSGRRGYRSYADREFFRSRGDPETEAVASDSNRSSPFFRDDMEGHEDTYDSSRSNLAQAHQRILHARVSVNAEIHQQYARLQLLRQERHRLEVRLRELQNSADEVRNSTPFLMLDDDTDFLPGERPRTPDPVALTSFATSFASSISTSVRERRQRLLNSLNNNAVTCLTSTTPGTQITTSQSDGRVLSRQPTSQPSQTQTSQTLLPSTELWNAVNSVDSSSTTQTQLWDEALGESSQFESNLMSLASTAESVERDANGSTGLNSRYSSGNRLEADDAVMEIDLPDVQVSATFNTLANGRTSESYIDFQNAGVGPEFETSPLQSIQMNFSGNDEVRNLLTPLQVSQAAVNANPYRVSSLGLRRDIEGGRADQEQTNNPTVNSLDDLLELPSIPTFSTSGDESVRTRYPSYLDSVDTINPSMSLQAVDPPSYSSLLSNSTTVGGFGQPQWPAMSHLSSMSGDLPPVNDALQTQTQSSDLFQNFISPTLDLGTSEQDETRLHPGFSTTLINSITEPSVHPQALQASSFRPSSSQRRGMVFEPESSDPIFRPQENNGRVSSASSYRPSYDQYSDLSDQHSSSTLRPAGAAVSTSQESSLMIRDPPGDAVQSPLTEDVAATISSAESLSNAVDSLIQATDSLTEAADSLLREAATSASNLMDETEIHQENLDSLYTWLSSSDAETVQTLSSSLPQVTTPTSTSGTEVSQASGGARSFPLEHPSGSSLLRRRAVQSNEAAGNTFPSNLPAQTARSGGQLTPPLRSLERAIGPSITIPQQRQAASNADESDQLESDQNTRRIRSRSDRQRPTRTWGLDSVPRRTLGYSQVQSSPSSVASSSSFSSRTGSSSNPIGRSLPRVTPVPTSSPSTTRLLPWSLYSTLRQHQPRSQRQIRLTRRNMRSNINRIISTVYAENNGHRAVVLNIDNTTYRLQWWDFTQLRLPEISRSDINVIVPHCKIYNDASIDVSKDGQFLATFVPTFVGYPDNMMNVGVFSLAPSTFGQLLFKKAYGPNAVCLSISPLCNHICVGLKSKQFLLGELRPNKHLMAQVLELANGNSAEMPVVRHIYHPVNDRPHRLVSINTISWVPEVGGGVVYGTNTGDLRMCSTSFKKLDSDEDPECSGNDPA